VLVHFAAQLVAAIHLAAATMHLVVYIFCQLTTAATSLTTQLDTSMFFLHIFM
jgi:hypothetical protein